MFMLIKDLGDKINAQCSDSVNPLDRLTFCLTFASLKRDQQLEILYEPLTMQNTKAGLLLRA